MSQSLIFGYLSSIEISKSSLVAASVYFPPQVQQRNLGVSGRIFAIETHRSKTGKGNECKLKVNFLPEIITLSKEVSAVRAGSKVWSVGNYA